MELEGGIGTLDQEMFPMPEEVMDQNNNSVNVGSTANTPSRADRFRDKVKFASKTFTVRGESSSSAQRSRTPKANHEMVNRWEQLSEGEIDGNESDTSSVKILPRSREEIEKEEEEFQQARQDLIQQAMSQSLQQMTQFMKDNGMILNPNSQRGASEQHFPQIQRSAGEPKKSLQSGKSRDQPDSRKGKNEGIMNGSSSSETTIYDRTIQPIELGEQQKISETIHNIHLLSDNWETNNHRRPNQRLQSDHFYAEQPRPGTSQQSYAMEVDEPRSEEQS